MIDHAFVPAQPGSTKCKWCNFAESAHRPAEELEAEEQLFENLPMRLNLGDYEIRSHIGWVAGFRNVNTGETRLYIRLDTEASEMLGDLVKVFELRGIGFAGVKRTAE